MEQVQNQATRFQTGSDISMSEAVYLHQKHVNQCKAILKYCGAQEQQIKEEKSLKTDLDNDFDKYSSQKLVHIFRSDDILAGCSKICWMVKAIFKILSASCTTCSKTLIQYL